MVLAVLAGVTPSANLDSSSLLAKAKQLVVAVDRCGSLAKEGGHSSSGCGRDTGIATSRIHVYRGSKDQTDRQTTRLWSQR